MKFATFILAVLIASASGLAAENPAIDNPMWRDPVCDPPPRSLVFPEELSGLWGKALQRSDSELRRAAADAIAIAQRQGMPGLSSLQGQLSQLLQAPEQDFVVRRAAAHALIALGARGEADRLAAIAATEGPEVARFVEPALARWGYGGLKTQWLERLADPAAPALSRRTAIDCLVIAQEAAAADPLMTIVRDPRGDIALRLAAAQALGGLSDSGLVEHARPLLSDKAAAARWNRVLGVQLLHGHRDAEAVAVLREAALDAEPAVASAALERLFEIEPRHLLDLAEKSLGNADVKVRRAAARALVVKADPEAVRLLASLLDDANPSLRGWVAQSLVELAARATLREVVIGAVERTLATPSWRGLEQATIVAVKLEHQAVAGRMIELMRHPRPEVGLAACFALRRFRLPETLPAMLEHATWQYERTVQANMKPHEPGMADEQQKQLFQSFADLRYAPAEPLLRKFVPKSRELGVARRSAACWALGYLHEGTPAEDLAGQFVDRMEDVNSTMPEVNEVRRMCAVSLGRMQAKSMLPVLQKFAELEGASEVGQACWWSIEQMTDAKRPAMTPYSQFVLGWFLQPVRTGSTTGE